MTLPNNFNVPVNQVYKNLHDPVTISLIKENLTKLYGIYAIVNHEDNKMYVGSSADLSRRILEHIRDKHSNIYLQNAIKKYGLANFSVCILELLDLYTDVQEDLKLNLLLLDKEQYYLDFFENKYNINPIAGKSRIGAKHTEVTKELMSKVRQENPYFQDKTHNPDVVEKMRLRMSGSNNHMYGKPVTEINRKLISKMFNKEVYIYDANTLILVEKYHKQKDVIESLQISPKTLLKYKDTGKVFRDKYIISSFKLN